MICVCIIMTGAPEGSTKSISGEAGNQTCNLWLQGIGLIHYNMADSRHRIPET